MKELYRSQLPPSPKKEKLINDDTIPHLTGRKSACVHDVASFFFVFLLQFDQGRTRQGHQTCSGRFQYSERVDKLEEGVDAIGLGRPGGQVAMSVCEDSADE